jgi:L-ascorbate metabolism protein UlaG (beta-lactamase superfamily)
MTTSDNAAGSSASLGVHLVGGPTAVLEIGGLRLLTDPTFDPPGDYPIGDRALTKTAPPAVGADDIGPIDLVLLSHDQHPDNLDHGGRAFLGTVPLVLSTASAAGRVAGVTALAPWTHHDVPRRDAATPLRVTAVPALHGPPGSEHLVGEVTGFVLSGDGVPTVYVSGDNASLDHVRAIAGRFPDIDVAVLFGGAARTPLVGDANLTLDAAGMVEATRVLGARQVVPVHVDGWAHFTEGLADVREAFARAGLADRLLVPPQA